MPGPVSSASDRKKKAAAYRKILRSPTRTVGRDGKSPSIAVKTGRYTGSDPKALRREKRIARAKRTIRRAQRRSALSGGSPRSEGGSTWTPNETATLQRAVGATPAEARALSTKTTGESAGNPKAIGNDPGGTTGLGLWQVTTGVGNDDVIAKYGGRKAMLKPKPNAKAALDIFRSQGIGAWYAPSTAPGKIRRAPSQKTPRLRRARRVLRRAGVKPPKAKAGSAGPRRLPGPYAGSQRAVLSAIPKGARAQGRGDKRTPSENASVGGASDSDHLTTNRASYAADIEPSQEVYNQIQRELGLPVTSTGSQTITRGGYRYQLIFGAEYDHDDHIHLGAEWTGAADGGMASSGSSSSASSASASAPSMTPAARRKRARRRRKNKPPINLGQLASITDTVLDSPDYKPPATSSYSREKRSADLG